MEQNKREESNVTNANDTGVRTVVRDAIEEFLKLQQNRAEPAYKAELVDERKRREQLERRVNELVEENRKSRQLAEEAERQSAVKGELQRLGVNKVDLAFKALKDDIRRTDDGRLVGRTGQDDVSLKDYLTQFVHENPEFLPARMVGGSGAAASQPTGARSGGGVDLDKLKPGISAEDLERIRQEVARVASETMRGA
jgi:hypothetical protein